MKLTEWFGPDVKPTLPGVYELRYGELHGYMSMPFPFHYWDGKSWCGQPKAFAADWGKKKDKPMRSGMTYIKTAQWRGLAEKP